jgi:hypothetical protein
MHPKRPLLPIAVGNEIFLPSSVCIEYYFNNDSIIVVLSRRLLFNMDRWNHLLLFVLFLRVLLL